MTKEDREKLCAILLKASADGGPFFGTPILEIAAGEIKRLAALAERLRSEIKEAYEQGLICGVGQKPHD